MIYHDYIILPDGEVYRQRTGDTAALDGHALDVCRQCRTRPEMMAAKVGLSVTWTVEPVGLLTVYTASDGCPLAVALMPRNAAELDATREAWPLIARIVRPFGAELSSGWLDTVYDLPAVLTVVLPVPRQDDQMTAGDMIRCWAAAWFEDTIEGDNAQ